MLAHAWAATSDCPLLRPVCPLALLCEAEVRTLYHQPVIWKQRELGDAPHSLEKGRVTLPSVPVSKRGMNLREGETESPQACPTRGDYLFVGEALVSEDFQQGGSIAVPPFEHLPHDAKQIPDPLWLAAPQRTEQTCPFSSSRRLRGGQIHGVHIAVKVGEWKLMTLRWS